MEKSLSRLPLPYLPPVIKIYHFFCCHHCMVAPSWNIYPFLLTQFEKILLNDGVKALEYLPSFFRIEHLWGWKLWRKSVSIRKETLMTLSLWKTVFTKWVLKCTFGLLSSSKYHLPSISMLMKISYKLTQGSMKTTSLLC